MIKKKGVLLTVACMLTCLTMSVASGCGGDSSKDSSNNSTQSEEIEISSLKLSESALNMEIYSEYTLEAETTEEGELTWKSSNPSIVSVEDGKLTALALGEATITVAQGDLTDTCVVMVIELSAYPVLETSANALELLINGEAVQVSASVRYKTEDVDCTFAWNSDNESVVTVQDGLVTPVGIGFATVTVSTVCYGEAVSKSIFVEVKPDMEIRVSTTALTLKAANLNEEDVTQGIFTAQAYRENVLDEDVVLSYRSSDENVAVVELIDSIPTVTAVGVGECDIIAYYDVDDYEVATAVKVTVSRSQMMISDEFVLEIADNSAVLDVGSLSLEGEFQGIYADGVLVSDGVSGNFLQSFINAHNDNVTTPIELRTSVASYAAQVRFILPKVLDTVIRQGDAGDVLAGYEGDETELGFAEGSYVQQFVVGEKQDIWGIRTIIDMDSTKDYVGFEFVLAQEFTTHHALTVWAVKDGTPEVISRILKDGGYDQVDQSVTVVITDAEGNDVTNNKLSANTLYTIKFYAKGATQLQVGTSEVNFTMYMSNVFVGNDEASDNPDTPAETVPENALKQGDSESLLAKYEGDETSLGFAEGTYVQQYAVGESIDFWKTRALIYTDSAKDYTSVEFVLTKSLSGVEALIVWALKDGTPVLIGRIGNGSFSVVTEGFNVVIQDANGNDVTNTTLAANTVYTLKIYFAGATRIDIGINQTDITMYFANASSGNDAAV